MPYSPEIEQAMRKYAATLNEKDRRRYAAIEALKLPPEGQRYIAQVLGCSVKTVRRGLRDLGELPEQPRPTATVRKPGGGRKSYTTKYPDIDAQFLAVLQEYTAGDPMDAQVVWTDLTPQAIVKLLAEHQQVQVSKSVVRKLLKKHHYRRRKAQKKQTLKTVPHRDEQFTKIKALRAEFTAAGNPVISFDTKKKEYLGNLYRAGQLYTRQELRTLDHDFTSAAEGLIIPHGIFDLQHNIGYIHLGASKDTSEFACDCIRAWWLDHGHAQFPHATALLGLCDGGGSNNSHHFIFKEDLQKLADDLGLEIRIAHYPPYCSKYNPIEHRVFPHITRACQGVILTSRALVKKLLEKTQTSKGLRVVVDIIETVYQTGRKVADDFKTNMRIIFDDVLPQWNYRAVPTRTVI
ncbi:MAG: ISAzo13 family transposase [Chloroflexi bacterium]|nr:ISAzo13 family transposase [Deltaproteobacteria bacterium]MBM4460713.1 ISAzo13 family transposase [Chloroflexota bacterium]